MRVFLVLIPILLASHNACAQKIVQRDTVGNLSGTLTHEGDRWVQRDKVGNMTGYYVREGHTIAHRDRKGDLIGREVIER